MCLCVYVCVRVIASTEAKINMSDRKTATISANKKKKRKKEYNRRNLF